MEIPTYDYDAVNSGTLDAADGVDAISISDELEGLSDQDLNAKRHELDIAARGTGIESHADAFGMWVVNNRSYANERFHLIDGVEGTEKGYLKPTTACGVTLSRVYPGSYYTESQLELIARIVNKMTYCWNKPKVCLNCIKASGADTLLEALNGV